MGNSDYFRGKSCSLFGGTGTGKTTLGNALIDKAKLPCIRYDPYQKEKIRVNKGDSSGTLKSVLLSGDFDITTNDSSFIMRMINVLVNCTFFIDEAGIFFDFENPEEMKRIFIANRHKGVFIIMVFHCFEDNPSILTRYTSWSFVKKTFDTQNYLNYIKRSDPVLWECITEVERKYKAGDKHYTKFISRR